jgi:hypothetical protein
MVQRAELHPNGLHIVREKIELSTAWLARARPRWLATLGAARAGEAHGVTARSGAALC